MSDFFIICCTGLLNLEENGNVGTLWKKLDQHVQVGQVICEGVKTAGTTIARGSNKEQSVQAGTMEHMLEQ